MVGDSAGDVLAALADPTRRQLLEVLATRGPTTATVLATELPVTRQAVAKHLAVLYRAGLIVARRHGREVRYTGRTEPLRVTARWLDRLAAEWDLRLVDADDLAAVPGPGTGGA